MSGRVVNGAVRLSLLVGIARRDPWAHVSITLDNWQVAPTIGGLHVDYTLVVYEKEDH
jgi:hypothetical protein